MHGRFGPFSGAIRARLACRIGAGTCNRAAPAPKLAGPVAADAPSPLPPHEACPRVQGLRDLRRDAGVGRGGIRAGADKIKNPTAVFAGLDKITGRTSSLFLGGRG